MLLKVLAEAELGPLTRLTFFSPVNAREFISVNERSQTSLVWTFSSKIFLIKSVAWKSFYNISPGINPSFHSLRHFSWPMRAQLTLLDASQPPPSPHSIALTSAHSFAVFHTWCGLNDSIDIAINPTVLRFVAKSFMHRTIWDKCTFLKEA